MRIQRYILLKQTSKKQNKNKSGVNEMWCNIWPDLFPQSLGRGPFHRQFDTVWHLGVHLGQTKVADLSHAVVRDQDVSSC